MTSTSDDSNPASNAMNLRHDSEPFRGIKRMRDESNLSEDGDNGPDGVDDDAWDRDAWDAMQREVWKGEYRRFWMPRPKTDHRNEYASDGNDKGNDKETVGSSKGKAQPSLDKTARADPPAAESATGTGKTQPRPFSAITKTTPPPSNTSHACTSLLDSRRVWLPAEVTARRTYPTIQSVQLWSAEKIAAEILRLERQQDTARAITMYRRRLAEHLQRELCEGQEALDALLEENKRVR